MYNLITATACHKKLLENGIVPWRDKSMFSKIVNREDKPIRFHTKPGSKKKWFIYEEVVEDIMAAENPRTEKHRAREDEKRKNRTDPLIDIDNEGMITVEGMSQEQLEEIRREQEARLMEVRAEANAACADEKADISDADVMDIKELNKAILYEELRLKRAKANEAEEKSIPVDVVRRELFYAARIFRDGVLGIPPRVAPRVAAENDPHECRIIIEKEIVKQLEALSETLASVGGAEE